MSAKALCRIPIWKGNRIVDEEHVKQLKSAIGTEVTRLDSGYRVIQYEEEDEKGGRVAKSYVVDGQHRIRVLSDYFQRSHEHPDFIVTVTEMELASEASAIQYFNEINTVKPIQFEEEPMMIINRYVLGLSGVYPGIIRPGVTRRPFLSADKLRTILLPHVSALKRWTVPSFTEACQKINQERLQQLREQLATIKEKDKKMLTKTVELGFTLAWDERFRWIEVLLQG